MWLTIRFLSTADGGSDQTELAQPDARRQPASALIVWASSLVLAVALLGVSLVAELLRTSYRNPF
ncbi:MAG: hypothetical protein FJW31_14575 [Acidobacteria bacterium]|nr:hypothetical protein [Acidobacteriota bacterium]